MIRFKKNLIFLSAALLLMTALTVSYITEFVPASVSTRRIPIYNVETNERKVAITFDAAWGNSDLLEILDILTKYDAKATFFVTGKWIDKYPDDIKLIHNKGHSVENHSDQHPHVAQIGSDSLRSDTIACNEKIQNVLGVTSKYYRAPYGEYNNNMMRIIEDELNMKVIQWDTDSRDWQESASVDSIVKYVMNDIKGGSIALFHVDAKPKCTAPALDIILDKLKSENYEFVLLDDLLIKDNYYIDHAGKQKRK